jgi:pimeloyl-ACP methyl ester carboxylesterase
MDCAALACAHPTASRTRKKQVDALVLLHGSASTGALWRGMRERLGSAYDVFAPDLIGYGAAPGWPDHRGLTLSDEVARVESILPCCDGDFHAVGYSYGGAVALALALAAPRRIKSLTLIEPVFFAALGRAGEGRALGVLQEIRDRFSSGLRSGRREEAMRDFIDFWSGSGAWARFPGNYRDATLAAADTIRLDWEACFAFDPPAEALAALGPRTLLVRGDRSPEPMIRLVDSLYTLMPGCERTIVPGATHLLPITHDAQIASALVGHLHASAERSLR